MSLFHKTMQKLTTPSETQTKLNDTLDTTNTRLREALDQLRKRAERAVNPPKQTLAGVK